MIDKSSTVTVTVKMTVGLAVNQSLRQQYRENLTVILVCLRKGPLSVSNSVVQVKVKIPVKVATLLLSEPLYATILIVILTIFPSGGWSDPRVAKEIFHTQDGRESGVCIPVWRRRTLRAAPLVRVNLNSRLKTLYAMVGGTRIR